MLIFINWCNSIWLSWVCFSEKKKLQFQWKLVENQFTNIYFINYTNDKSLDHLARVNMREKVVIRNIGGGWNYVLAAIYELDLIYQLASLFTAAWMSRLFRWDHLTGLHFFKDNCFVHEMIQTVWRWFQPVKNFLLEIRNWN